MRQHRSSMPSLGMYVAAVACLSATCASAQISQVTTCDAAGIGALTLAADAPVTILSATPGTATSGNVAVPYCLVKVQVPTAINIWFGLPMNGTFNGRFQALGGGGYAGSIAAPTGAVVNGYAGAFTDTGHTGFGGSFALSAPGVPNTPLKIDFAYRSEHLMAVLAKQLIQAFYGQPASRSYWAGCSTGGRQGLRMVQDFPDDYDGVVAGAPAIHWDRFIAAEIWPQVVMNVDLGGPMSSAKETLVTNAAIAACDANDGLVDGLIDDPRACSYDPQIDPNITKASCTSSDNSCLTSAEAAAVVKIWNGPRSSQGSGPRGSGRGPQGVGKPLWYGLERGAPLNGLAGTNPFPIAVDHLRYWTFLDPSFDWRTLDYANYGEAFDLAVSMMNALMASDNPDISAFRDHDGKLIMYHGWTDQLIMPRGTLQYYKALRNFAHGSYAELQQDVRLFMAPGMTHCGGGAGPNAFGQPTSAGPTNATPLVPDADHDVFRALVRWVEQGVAPEKIIATHYTNGQPDRTRPLCPYPAHAVYIGTGSIDDAANFECVDEEVEE